jgi:hypothetical protein
MTTRREDYAPYHTFPEFEQGILDYQACRPFRELSGVAAQAYDRGAEYAMKISRETGDLAARMQIVLAALRQHVEYEESDGWGMVYLDNAVPPHMSTASFRSYLAKLSEQGAYKPIDRFAWGLVKLKD